MPGLGAWAVGLSVLRVVSGPEGLKGSEPTRKPSMQSGGPAIERFQWDFSLGLRSEDLREAKGLAPLLETFLLENNKK